MQTATKSLQQLVAEVKLHDDTMYELLLKESSQEVVVLKLNCSAAPSAAEALEEEEEEYVFEDLQQKIRKSPRKTFHQALESSKPVRWMQRAKKYLQQLVAEPAHGDESELEWLLQETSREKSPWCN